MPSMTKQAQRTLWLHRPNGVHKGWRNEITGVGSAIDSDDPFEVKRQRIADAIARAVDFPDPDEIDTLPVFGPEYALYEIHDELKDADDFGHLDLCLVALYDWADEHRVWVKP